jgi:hypothetical protein
MRINIYVYCDGIWPFATQLFGKHLLKTGIATEAEVHLLGNENEKDTDSIVNG